MGFAGARYTIKFVMTYGVVWIIFLNAECIIIVYEFSM